MNNDASESKENGVKDEGLSEESSSTKKSPIHLITRITITCTILFFIWYVLSERHTPYTDQARIKGLITPVTARVSGNIIKLNITLHKKINIGDTLFELDKKPFQIAVSKAEAEIDNATQSVAASTASVKASAGRLGVARAQLERAERNWNRVQKVMKENSGALSEADKDQSETAYYQAIEQVASAEANLERDQQRLGDSGPDNPKIRIAIQNLEKAQMDLAFTTVVAPTDGVIESFDIDIGYYVASGQPLTTLISSSDIWIQADMKENNLSMMKIGDRVDISFDIAPGKVFKGSVRSLGFGVATDETKKGSLPSVSSKQGWLRDPQRFPVIISVKNDQEIIHLYRIGGQADIVVYTGNNFILNALGSLRIRLNSLISYVR